MLEQNVPFSFYLRYLMENIAVDEDHSRLASFRMRQIRAVLVASFISDGRIAGVFSAGSRG